MDICRDIEDFREARASLDGTVGFVPTMGALHEGHLALMRAASERADHLVVSIFVNPTQFEPGSDFEGYPRELERDAEKCEAVGCELIFAPTESEMYDPQHATTVRVDGMTDVLCGPERPGHFDGVTTVVSKLLNIVDPDVAAFGRKDYQQLAILKRMAADLNYRVEIIGVTTVREDDGLAVSSRNRYLDAGQRRDAVALSQALRRAWLAYEDGERRAERLVEVARRRLLESVHEEAIEYLQVVHPETLELLSRDGHDPIAESEGAVMAMAVQIGEARLIDNLRLDGPLPDELVE